MSSKKLNPFKDFQSDQIQRSSRKIFTAHYPCRNAALNLTPVTGTTNGFIFRIINSLIESWGVRLTWFDCNLYQILTIIESVPIRVEVGQAGCRLISYANDRAFHPAFSNGALATFCYNNAYNNHNLLQPEFDSSRRDKVPRIFQSCNPRILLLR